MWRGNYKSDIMIQILSFLDRMAHMQQIIKVLIHTMTQIEDQNKYICQEKEILAPLPSPLPKNSHIIDFLCLKLKIFQGTRPRTHRSSSSRHKILELIICPLIQYFKYIRFVQEEQNYISISPSVTTNDNGITLRLGITIKKNSYNNSY